MPSFFAEAARVFGSFPVSESASMALPSVAAPQSGRRSRKRDSPPAATAECARRYLPISPAQVSSAQRPHPADCALHNHMTRGPPRYDWSEAASNAAAACCCRSAVFIFEYAAHTSSAIWSRSASMPACAALLLRRRLRYLMFASRAVKERPLELQANVPESLPAHSGPETNPAVHRHGQDRHRR